MTQVTLSQIQTAGLWESVWKLLRMRLLLTWSNFRRAKPRQKISYVIFILFLAAISTSAFVFSQVFIRFLSTPALAEQINLTSLFTALPGLVLSIAFFINLVSNFGVLLQALYLSRDMDFLIAAPIPMRAVFITKLVQAILPGFGLFCLVGLPLLFGLGSASGYHAIYYPLVVIDLAVLALAAAGIASILVMAVVRVIPARRAAEILGFVGATIAILFSQLCNLSGSMNISGDQLTGAFGRFASLAPGWSPFTWAGRGLIDLGQGAWLSGAALTLLTLLASAGLFGATLVLCERLYYTGWARLQGSAQKKKGQGKQKASDYTTAAARVGQPNPMRSIIVKDFLLMRRDLRNLSQLITPLILGVVMIFTSSRSASSSELFSEVPISGLPVYTNVMFTFFVGWMLMFNLSTTSFSREGKNYWLMNASPIQPGQLIIAKYIVAYLPTLVIGWAFVVITSLIRHVALTDMIYTLLVTALCFAGLNGLLLAFSIAGANLDWEDPRKIGLRSGPGCLSIVVSFLFFAVSLGIFLGPPALWEILRLDNLWIGRGIGLILGAIFTLMCAILPPNFYRSRIALIGQPKT